MSERGIIIGALTAVAVAGVVGGALAAGPDLQYTSSAAAEQPTIGAPPDSGPPDPRVVLDDPAGSVDRLSAAGEHVAWTVRYPADELDPEAEREPVSWPESSKVVVLDEAGARTFTIDYGKRWISEIRFVSGPQAIVDPKLAVRSCASRDAASCKVELLSLASGGELGVVRRETGALADAAIEGRLSGSQELIAGEPANGGCLPPQTVEDRAAGTSTALPALPERDGWYPTCRGLSSLFLSGPYAFATVDRVDPKHGDLEAQVVYGLDLRIDQSRWSRLRVASSVSDGGAGVTLGPAMALNAMYWESVDVVGDVVESFDADRLADAIRTPRSATKVISPTPDWTHPDVCAIAATITSVYELSNPRCAVADRSGPGGAKITRLENPPLNR